MQSVRREKAGSGKADDEIRICDSPENIRICLNCSLPECHPQSSACALSKQNEKR